MNMWLQIIVSDVSQLLPVKCGAESQSKEKKEAKDRRVVNTRWNLDHGVTDKVQSVIGRQHTQRVVRPKGVNMVKILQMLSATFNSLLIFLAAGWITINVLDKQESESGPRLCLNKNHLNSGLWTRF